MLYYLMENQFFRVPKMLHLSVCVTFMKIYIKLPNCSCVLNCCSEFPGVFVPDVEINDRVGVNLPFIRFHHHKNIISCSLHKQLFHYHVKTCPPRMNIENVKKGKVTTWKSLILK